MLTDELSPEIVKKIVEHVPEWVNTADISNSVVCASQTADLLLLIRVVVMKDMIITTTVHLRLHLILTMHNVDLDLVDQCAEVGDAIVKGHISQL